MNRRTFLTLLAAPAAYGVLETLGGRARAASAVPAGIGSLPPTTLATSATIAGAPGTPQTAASLAAAITQFGNDCYAAMVAQHPTGNLVISPASIAIALTMTLAGAKGATATQMATTLHVDPASVQSAAKELLSMMAAAAQAGGEKTTTLTMANSVWVQRGLPLDPTFTATLHDSYGAAAQLADFKADTEAARRAINAWVDEQTRHRIPELLASGMLSDATRLALVNAIYLKATWARQFDKLTTRPAPFKTPNGTKQVPMMSMRTDLNYVVADGWQAVEMPYQDGDLSMIFMLPDDERNLAAGPLQTILWTATSASTKVDLGVPKFDLATATELAELLAKLGMPAAFSDTADFSGITASEPVRIGAVVHQANITVHEAGTEAAAATAAVMVAGAAPGPEPKPVPFVLDRPFSFAVVDRRSGAALFLGRVTDPAVN